VRDKFGIHENWQVEIPEFVHRLFPDVEISPKFMSWILEALKTPMEKALKKIQEPVNYPDLTELDLEEEIDDGITESTDQDNFDESFQSLLNLAKE